MLARFLLLISALHPVATLAQPIYRPYAFVPRDPIYLGKLQVLLRLDLVSDPQSVPQERGFRAIRNYQADAPPSAHTSISSILLQTILDPSPIVFDKFSESGMFATNGLEQPTDSIFVHYIPVIRNLRNKLDAIKRAADNSEKVTVYLVQEQSPEDGATPTYDLWTHNRCITLVQILSRIEQVERRLRSPFTHQSPGGTGE